MGAGMKYHQLSAEERFLIATLRRYRVSIPDIAATLEAAPYDRLARTATQHGSKRLRLWICQGA
jgi:IS30 family transposase